MKALATFFLIALLSVSAALAQHPTATCTIKHFKWDGSSSYTFEVWVQNTTTPPYDIGVVTSTFSFNYNNNVISSLNALLENSRYPHPPYTLSTFSATNGIATFKLDLGGDWQYADNLSTTEEKLFTVYCAVHNSYHATPGVSWNNGGIAGDTNSPAVTNTLLGSDNNWLMSTANANIQNVSRINSTYQFEMWGQAIITRSDSLSVKTSTFKFRYNSVALSTPVVVVAPRYADRYTATAIADSAGGGEYGGILTIKLNFVSAPYNNLSTIDGGELVFTVSLGITDPSGLAGLTWMSGGFTNVYNQLTGQDNSPLPIQLASFTATTITSKGVTLTWETGSEVNNYGFYVQRDGLDIGFIAGHGTTLQRQTYTYTDKNPLSGKHNYRLKQIDLDRTATLSVAVVVDVPVAFALDQNYPNPFNPSTTIHYGLPQKSAVHLTVFNSLGQQVAQLVNGEQEAGYHEVEFDGSGLASGVYLYRIQAGSFVQTRKLLLLR